MMLEMEHPKRPGEKIFQYFGDHDEKYLDRFKTRVRVAMFKATRGRWVLQSSWLKFHQHCESDRNLHIFIAPFPQSKNFALNPFDDDMIQLRLIHNPQPCFVHFCRIDPKGDDLVEYRNLPYRDVDRSILMHSEEKKQWFYLIKTGKVPLNANPSISA